jgi:ATP-dependent DNA ligase
MSSTNERYSRQKYTDIDIAQVDQVSHPICQLKYDGIWCQCDVDTIGTARYFSRNGECKKIEKISLLTPPGSYVGELMYGSEWSKEMNRSGKFFLFDHIESNHGCHKNQPYIERYIGLQKLQVADMLPSHWYLAPNYPTSDSLTIWELLIASGKFEGLVFRNPVNNWHAPLLRAKYELTKDLYITGFVEGEGRLRGTLGALLASYSPVGVGVSLTIGGGFSDKLRKEIWSNRSTYVGRCFEVSAKKEFKSGLLRHPNFKQWHLEK